MSAGFVLVLTGGIGGAKLCLGLQRLMDPAALRIGVNTGDDFVHLGLRICPDVDTTLYTLSGLANPQLGWGRKDETWTFMQALGALGGDTWFRLGDGDLALHIERTRRMAAGETLSCITGDIANRLGIRPTVVPMSDDPVSTVVHTDEGEIEFQDYFVRRQCAPPVRSIRFRGAATARVADGIRASLLAEDLQAVIIAPSNPYLSIDPILALPDMRTLLRESGVPIVAVTPIVGGAAVKGPTAKIMRELGIEPSPLAIAQHYHGLIGGFVLDSRDAPLADRFDVPVAVCDTLMLTLEDRERVAAGVLEFVAGLKAAQ